MTARRILMVAAMPFPAPFGSQVYVAGQAGALAAAGHTVTLATYGGGAGRWPTGVQGLAVGGEGSVRRTTGPTVDKAWRDALLVRAVARHLDRSGADVMHAHHVEGVWAAWLARRATGVTIPIVYDAHTLLGQELGAWTTPRWSGPARWAGDHLDRLAVGCADAVVALSSRAEAPLRRLGAKRVDVVPPGIDPAEVRGGDEQRARRRWSLGDGAWVLYTGNDDVYQDTPVLWEAMASVPEAGLLVLTTSDAARVRSAVRRWGGPDARVRVVLHETVDDLRDAHAAAALAAVPRTVCAGFPIKLLNALAAGLPVVCAQGSAVPIEGVVPVPDGDPRAMAGAIRSVLRADGMGSRLGAAAARAVDAGWTWPVRSRAIAKIHDEVTAR